jgi:cytochrome c
MKKIVAIALLTGLFSSLMASASLYNSKCASCHGANADKSALGKSAKIAGWSKSKLVSAMNGYKAGTYGGGNHSGTL